MLGCTGGGAAEEGGVLGLSACCWDLGPPQLITSMVLATNTRAIAPILTALTSLGSIRLLLSYDVEECCVKFT